MAEAPPLMRKTQRVSSAAATSQTDCSIGERCPGAGEGMPGSGLDGRRGRTEWWLGGLAGVRLRGLRTPCRSQPGGRGRRESRAKSAWARLLCPSATMRTCFSGSSAATSSPFRIRLRALVAGDYAYGAVERLARCCTRRARARRFCGLVLLQVGRCRLRLSGTVWLPLEDQGRPARC